MKITDLKSPPTALAASEVPNSWVLPDQKIVFVSIGKNACTTIKWILAEISEQNIRRFMNGTSAESTRRMLIHDRRLWRGTPRLSELDSEGLAAVAPDNGWFVFAVVRDPRLRLWSAWQSKFLVGDPIYSGRKHAGRPWLPRTPESAKDVLEDWKTFVSALGQGPGKGVPAGDGHFAPQTMRLHEEVVPYSHLYEISELPRLTEDLDQHLRKLGTPQTLVVSRENDTPLPAGREVFAEEVLERVEKIYAADLNRFGYLWPFDKTMSRPIAWSDEALRDIASRRAINERVADLHTKVQSLKREAVQLRSALNTSEAQPPAATDGRRTKYREILIRGKRVGRRIVPTTRQSRPVERSHADSHQD